MRLLLFTITLGYSLMAHATIYRWVDADGTVRYSDTPHVNAERLKLQTAPATSLLPQDSPEKPAKDAPDPSTPLAAGKAEATQRERCDEFRARVKRYLLAGDMFTENPDGSRHQLVAEERKSLIERTQAQANQACEKADE